MLKRLALFFFLFGVTALGAPPYEPTWNSVDRRPTPAWFSDAKFGIFIHWGVYSVPAFAAAGVPKEQPYAEWYWNSMTTGRQAPNPNAPGTAAWKFHQRVYGAEFSYPEFAPMFRAELFDPDRRIQQGIHDALRRDQAGGTSGEWQGGYRGLLHRQGSRRLRHPAAVAGGTLHNQGIRRFAPEVCRLTWHDCAVALEGDCGFRLDRIARHARGTEEPTRLGPEAEPMIKTS